MTEAPRPERPPRPCPLCQKMSVAAFHPFCSKRCADVDLNRWFSGAYAAPAEDQSEDGGDAPAPPRRDDDA